MKIFNKLPCKNQSSCKDADLKFIIFHIQHHQNVKGIIYLFYSTMLSSKNVFENRIHQLISTILVTWFYSIKKFQNFNTIYYKFYEVYNGLTN
jgi:hypothetical protein